MVCAGITLNGKFILVLIKQKLKLNCKKYQYRILECVFSAATILKHFLSRFNFKIGKQKFVTGEFTFNLDLVFKKKTNLMIGCNIQLKRLAVNVYFFNNNKQIVIK